MALNILAVRLIRRHHRKKKQRLPAAPNAVPYQPGEYWEQRRTYLSESYVPPAHLLPSGAVPGAPTYSSAEMAESRNSLSTLVNTPNKGLAVPPRKYPSR